MNAPTEEGLSIGRWLVREEWVRGSAPLARGSPGLTLFGYRRNERLARRAGSLAIEHLFQQQPHCRLDAFVAPGLHAGRGANRHRRRAERDDAVDLGVGEHVRAVGAQPLA